MRLRRADRDGLKLRLFHSRGIRIQARHSGRLGGGRGDIRRGHRNVAGFRRGLAEEVLRRGLHRIRHHRLDDGAGCRVAERVHAKRAARAQNDGLDGLTAALFYLGMVRAQVDVKGRAGPRGADLDGFKFRGGLRRGHIRRIRSRRRLITQVGVLGRLGLCLTLQLFGHLMAPGEHTGQPAGSLEAGFFVVLKVLVQLVGIFLLVGSFFRLRGKALRPAFRAAGGVLLIDGHAFFVHAAAHAAEPLPDFRRGDIKNVQAGAEGQRRHDQIGCRAPAEQQQIAAQHGAQRAAGQPGVDAVLVTGGYHGRRWDIGGDIREYDDRAAGKHQPQQQPCNVGQQVFAAGVQDGQIAQRRAHHKAAAAKHAKQRVVQSLPDRTARHKSQRHEDEAQKQGHQPRRHPVLCPASPALSAAPRSGFSFPFCHVRSSLSFL